MKVMALKETIFILRTWDASVSLDIHQLRSLILHYIPTSNQGMFTQQYLQLNKVEIKHGIRLKVIFTRQYTYVNGTLMLTAPYLIWPVTKVLCYIFILTLGFALWQPSLHSSDCCSCSCILRINPPS